MRIQESSLRVVVILFMSIFIFTACGSDGPPPLDTDGDGIPDTSDTDDDNDGVADATDAFPLDATESVDTDGDGIGNNADTDDDGDLVADASDAFPLDATESVDTDGDGVGNNADTDDDGDAVADTNDAFPLDPTETLDSDADGVGNNADPDDDNDNTLDANDDFPLNPSRTMAIQVLYPQINGIFQLPSTPVATQMTWILEQLAAPSTSIPDIEAHFFSTALSSTPAVDWQTFFDTVRAVVPNGQIVDLLAATPTRIDAVVGDPSQSSGTGIFFSLQTRLGGGGLILSLTGSNIPLGISSVGTVDAALTLTEAVDKFGTFAADTSVLVARIDEDNQCVSVFDRNADVPRFMGAGFQGLWILGALAEALDEGTVSADQEVILDADNLTTLGVLGFELGTQVTVGDLMAIALDREPGALDQMLSLVSRTSVEAVVSQYDHQNIDLMTPFLKASDYFSLFLRIPEADALAYVASTEDEQRMFLDSVITPLGPYNLVTSAPFRNTSVLVSANMQASPMDVCNAIAKLHQFNDRSDAFSVIDRAFGAKSFFLGLRDEWERVWQYFGLTSSIAVGLQMFDAAWLLESDGRGTFVVVAMANNPDDSLERIRFFPTISVIARMLELVETPN